ncbi:hypothetical protein KM043_008766 [Ampulex compressa]|nr:hypothetical protein KM043_008766 [Ampulex compressa]
MASVLIGSVLKPPTEIDSLRNPLFDLRIDHLLLQIAKGTAALRLRKSGEASRIRRVFEERIRLQVGGSNRVAENIGKSRGRKIVGSRRRFVRNFKGLASLVHLPGIARIVKRRDVFAKAVAKEVAEEEGWNPGVLVILI